jgi:hypothetical protein
MGERPPKCDITNSVRSLTLAPRKGIISEDHPLALGVLADSGHAATGKAWIG